MSVKHLDPLRLPWPVHWATLFEQGRRHGAEGKGELPLLVEIGFGGGDSLVELARRNPWSNVLGVEISLPSIRRALKRGRRLGLDNLHLVQADARAFLWLLCEPASLSAIILNFPDPWPKERHHRRRLINDRFLALAASRMRPGARLEVATDHADYARWIADHLIRTPYFDSQGGAVFLTEDADRVRTKYERIALAEGRTCHYFKWQRNQSATTEQFPIPPEVPMPHIILSTTLSLDEIEAAFEPQGQAAGSINVRLIELFRSTQADRLLLESHVAEDPIDQRVALTIEAREGGELLLGVHELGFPRPTSGIHQALSFLADWLLALQPEGQIIKSNIRDAIRH